MAELKLTYIVPLYNNAQFVLRCLNTIVEQGIPVEDYEVIVVDDGSTDGGQDVVDDFSRQNPQVKVIHQSNAGVSAARNRAIQKAQGRYLQFVDADDYLAKGMMAPLLQRAIDLDVEAMEFNYVPVDAEGRAISDQGASFYPSTELTTGVEYLTTHAITSYVWRFLIRRDFFLSGNWRFDESLIACEDGSLIARFLLNASRVAHDVAAPYRYVQHAASAMHNPDPQHLRRRVFSQVDAAASIDKTIRDFEASSGKKAPASVAGLRNVYLYFSMTKALTCGLVDEVLQRIRQAGLYPFPCVGPESNYHGMKWKLIHMLMMKPGLWKALSKLYRLIK